VLRDATPLTRPAKGSAASLAATQSALFSLITGHGARAIAPEAATLVAGDARASAAERVHVYAHMYRARLVEALEAQYPRVASRLGCDAFAALAADYTDAHPSRHPSLRFLGQHLAAWLDANPDGADLAALARLEWARADVFDERDEPLLDLEAVRAWPPEQLGALPIRVAAASRLIELEAGALALWDEPEGEASASGRTSVLVWRKEVTVYHRAVEPAERDALARAAEGTTFGALCEALAAALPAEEAIQRAFAWLSTWLADGLLVADLRTSTSPP
jgi:hypothetical protein